MRLIQQQIPRDANIFMFSCTHWGSRLHHERGWKKLVNMMLSSYAGLDQSCNFGIHHGDIIEGKLIDDPHFAIPTNADTDMLQQIIKSVTSLTPIKHKLITILRGNHEEKLRRFGDIAAFICRDLGVLYGTKSVRITYMDKKNRPLFKHLATHGKKQVGSIADDIIRQESNMALQLKRHLSVVSGDTLLNSKGHTHKLFVVTPKPALYLMDTGSQIKQKRTKIEDPTGYISPDLRWYVNVGAFYRVYGDELTEYDIMKPEQSAFSSYVEELELPPAVLGFAVALVRNGIVQAVNQEIV